MISFSIVVADNHGRHHLSSSEGAERNRPSRIAFSEARMNSFICSSVGSPTVVKWIETKPLAFSCSIHSSNSLLILSSLSGAHGETRTHTSWVTTFLALPVYQFPAHAQNYSCSPLALASSCPSTSGATGETRTPTGKIPSRPKRDAATNYATIALFFQNLI